LTRRLDAEDLTCLNYGYEEDPPMGLALAASDEPNRVGIQLYHRVASQSDLNAKQVLEVSCGHGGGASYLTRTLHPASYTGWTSTPTVSPFAGREMMWQGWISCMATPKACRLATGLLMR
jgi:hypothetical protein